MFKLNPEINLEKKIQLVGWISRFFPILLIWGTFSVRFGNRLHWTCPRKLNYVQVWCYLCLSGHRVSSEREVLSLSYQSFNERREFASGLPSLPVDLRTSLRLSYRAFPQPPRLKSQHRYSESQVDHIFLTANERAVINESICLTRSFLLFSITSVLRF